MKYLYRIWVLLVLLLTGWQTVSASWPEPKFSHYSTEDGLSHDGVLCITQDREGFIWLGTWDGINRFDGNNFTAYKSEPGDRSVLKNNKVKDITEDPAGYLWVLTYDKKAYRFDKKTEQFSAITHSVSGENLSNVTIERIIPLSNGDTWMITSERDALCISNGHEDKLQVIHFNQDRDLKKINFIYEDQQRRVWLGTGQGLVCLVKRNGKYVSGLSGHKKLYCAGLNITSVSENSSAVIFGSSDGVLVEYLSEKKTLISHKLGNNEIHDICLSRSGDIYVTAGNLGLVLYNRKNGSIHQAGNEKRLHLYSIFEDSRGNVWLEAEKEGVYKYSPDKGTFKYFNHAKEDGSPYGRPTDGTYKVFEDVNGVVWISLKGGGFGYYDSARDNLAYFYNRPGSPDKLFSNSIVSAFSDNKGVLWFSSRNGGLNRVVFPAGNFKHQVLVEESDNKFDNEVRALLQDQHGKTWITTKKGKLYVYQNGKEIKDVLTVPNQNLGSIYCITEGQDGTIWIGTKGQGLIRLDPENQSHTRYRLTRYVNNPADPSSLSGNKVYSVLTDDSGRVWIGTFGSSLNLLVSQGGKVSFKNIHNDFRHYPKHTFNVIRHIIQGPDRNIWLATTDGLLRFDPDEHPGKLSFMQTTKIPGDPSSLGNNDLLYLYPARNGDVWIGTFGGGLNRVLSHTIHKKKALKFQVFTKDHGLPNDIVLSMVEDNKGNLWVATENGLSKLDIKRESFRNYDSYDGLPGTRFSEAGAFRAKNGEIFFGCANGYISFYPDKIRDQKFRSSLVFTGIQLYNEDIRIKSKDSPLRYAINYTRNMTLKHDQNVITFEYAVLDFRLSKNISYSYILEGYDKGWHHVKNLKKATYTKIPPGEYTFRVKTTDNYHFNNVPEKSISIKILKPWWLSNGAMFAYFLVAVLVAEMVRRFVTTLIGLKNKVIVEKKMTELKLQLFTNISHELRTPLTLIVNPLNKIKNTEALSENGRDYLDIAGKNVDRMMRFVNQLLDFRKIQNQSLKLNVQKVDLGSLMEHTAAYFKDISLEKNIRLNILKPGSEPLIWCDEEKIEIVFFNLLSNAIKFTPTGKRISISIENSHREYTTVSVRDEGAGLPENKLEDIFRLYYEGNNQQDKAFKGTGIGLALSRDIVRLHKGKIYAQRNATEGLTFRVELLKGHAHYDKADLENEEPASDIQEQTLQPQTEHKTTRPDLSLDGCPKLLIVEDNRDVRRLIVDQFDQNYQVLEAENGLEGYEKAVGLLPDVIISDVVMPVMDGIQMLDKLKNEITTSHIPVILLTARSSVEDQIKGLSSGADFYITKPFHSEYIEHLIHNLINQRQRMVASILERSQQTVSQVQDTYMTPRDGKFLKDVAQIIEDGMSDIHFNIDAVAVAIGMGRTTFYKKIKSLTGMSPVEFVRDIRLKKASELLDASEMSISEVAYMVGFNSSGYFSTCFKEKYKVSPSDYVKDRKECKQSV